MHDFQFFKNNALLSITSKKFKFSRSSTCENISYESWIYRNLSEIPGLDEITMQRLLQSPKEEESWRETIATTCLGQSHNLLQESAAAIKFLNVLINLPLRLWNREWKKARQKLIQAKKKMLCGGRLQSQRMCCLHNKASKTPYRSLYEDMVDIQLHFYYVCTAVMNAMLLPETRVELAQILAKYYLKRSLNDMDFDFNTPKFRFFNFIDFHKGSRCSDISEPMQKVCLLSSSSSNERFSGPRSAYRAYMEILCFYRNFQKKDSQDSDSWLLQSLDPYDCLEVFDWCASGFEFHGVWFQLVTNVTLWKTVKREIALARHILLNSDYPCPPLLFACETFQFPFVASALLVNKNSYVVTPPQIPPRIATLTVARINKTYRSKSYYDFFSQKDKIKFLVHGLANPSQLLTLHAPCFFPQDLLPEYYPQSIRLTLAFMCLSDWVSHPSIFKSISARQLDNSLYLFLSILQGEPIRSIDTLQTGIRNYLQHYILCNVSYKQSRPYKDGKENPTHEFCKGEDETRQDSTLSPLFALGFFENDLIPRIMTFESGYIDLHVLRRFCSFLFDCEVDFILPYDPLLEKAPFLELEKSLWAINFFGFPCSVWVSTKRQSRLHSFHSLRVDTPSRNLRFSSNRNSILFPWHSPNFVLLPGPCPLFFRPEVYLSSVSHPNVTNVYDSLVEIGERIIVACLNTSSSLHQVIHHFRLPVSSTLWQLWILCREKIIPHPMVSQLVACDLVASAVWCLSQYYATCVSQSL